MLVAYFVLLNEESGRYISVSKNAVREDEGIFKKVNSNCRAEYLPKGNTAAVRINILNAYFSVFIKKTSGHLNAKIEIMLYSFKGMHICFDTFS